eukprot:scaffold622175_cov32-Prasinocladus_malaysianus.AAC.1
MYTHAGGVLRATRRGVGLRGLAPPGGELPPVGHEARGRLLLQPALPPLARGGTRVRHGRTRRLSHLGARQRAGPAVLPGRVEARVVVVGLGCLHG